MKTSSPLAAAKPVEKSRTPVIITIAIVIAIYALVFILEQVLPPSSMLFTYD